MPVYKVLQPNSLLRKAPSESAVHDGINRWNSFEDAVNELGKSGWTVDARIYGAVPGRGHEGQLWLEAVILLRDEKAARGCGKRIFWFYDPPESTIGQYEP